MMTEEERRATEAEPCLNDMPREISDDISVVASDDTADKTFADVSDDKSAEISCGAAACDAPVDVCEETAVLKKKKKEKKRKRDTKHVSQRRELPRGKGERGGWIVYSVLVTLALLISLVVLTTVMAVCGVFEGIVDKITNDGSDDDAVTVEKYIYVREDGTTGRLSVAEIAAKVSPSVVGITVKKTASSGVGSGIIKTSDGYILTNYHVTDDATEIYVVMPDGMNYPAQYIGGNELADVAVIKIDAADLPAAEFGDSDSLVVGETTVAIGTPGSIEYAGTVTTGIVSCVRRNVGFYDDSGLLQKTMHLIQTSTQINPGNSGGPLIDGDGKVIGINTYKIKSEGFEGLGFAIPINGVLKVYDAILAGDNYETGGIVSLSAKLGITGMAVTRGMSFSYENETGEVTDVASTDGVAVITIASDKYDAALKLKPGDIIISIDGVRASTIEDIREVVARKMPGESVKLIISRAGMEMKISVMLGT